MTMRLVLSISGINGYSSIEYSLSYSTEYSTPKLLVSGSPNYKKLCYCRRARATRFVSQISIRDDGIAANTAMITVHRAQQNLHHCQKSTSSQYYRLTRLESTLSIDSTSALIDRLDRFQGLLVHCHEKVKLLSDNFCHCFCLMTSSNLNDGSA